MSGLLMALLIIIMLIFLAPVILVVLQWIFVLFGVVYLVARFMDRQQ